MNKIVVKQVGSKENPLKIIQRLIDRKADGLLSGSIERTCRYPTIGGKL